MTLFDVIRRHIKWKDKNGWLEISKSLFITRSCASLSKQELGTNLLTLLSKIVAFHFIISHRVKIIIIIMPTDYNKFHYSITHTEAYPTDSEISLSSRSTFNRYNKYIYTDYESKYYYDKKQHQYKITLEQIVPPTIDASIKPIFHKLEPYKIRKSIESLQSLSNPPDSAKTNLNNRLAYVFDINRLYKLAQKPNLTDFLVLFLHCLVYYPCRTTSLKLLLPIMHLYAIPFLIRLCSNKTHRRFFI